MNKLTEVVFILDRSGSMSGREEFVVKGFNDVLREQRQAEGEALISTLLFSDKSKVLRDRVPIGEVCEMSVRDYCPGGCTALLDAIGRGINHIGHLHKRTPAERVPGKTLFVIITDGLENASRNYSLGRIKKMISNRQEKYGWEFLFLGANIDAISVAEDIGICQKYATTFCCDKTGLDLNFMAVNECIESIRSGKEINPDWKKRIDEDFLRRGR